MLNLPSVILLLFLIVTVSSMAIDVKRDFGLPFSNAERWKRDVNKQLERIHPRFRRQWGGMGGWGPPPPPPPFGGSDQSQSFDINTPFGSIGFSDNQVYLWFADEWLKMNRKKHSKRGGSQKKKKEKQKSKKKFKKEDSEEESSGDDEDDTSTGEEEGDKTEQPKQPASLPPPPEKTPLLGALSKAPQQPPWFKMKLYEEIRPDLVPPTGRSLLESHEIDLLDNFLRGNEQLQAGDLVIADDNLDEESREYSRYEVLIKYNEGRYSAVYIVVKQTCTDNEEVLDSTLYAMKSGLRKDSPCTKLRFKRELQVLKDLKNGNAMRSPHLIDSGRVCDRSYIVMTLLDRNLEKLKESVKGTFRPTSVYHLAAEALSAIEDVHVLGYVHRDVKPTNFCVGLQVAAVRLFLIDFGETVKSGKAISYATPDAYSLPYMSIDAHKRAVAKPKMDLESWFYTFSELLYPQILTWKQSHNEAEIQEAKTKFWDNLAESLTSCSPQMKEAAKIIKSATDKIDYNGLRRLMDEARDSHLKGTPLTLEWVKKMPKVMPKRGEPINLTHLDTDQSTRSSKKKQKEKAQEKVSHVDELRKSLTMSLFQRFRFRPKKKKLATMIANSDAGSAESTSGEGQASDSVAVEPSEKPKSENVEPTPAQEKQAKDEPKESVFERSIRRIRTKLKGTPKPSESTSSEKSAEPAKSTEPAAPQQRPSSETVKPSPAPSQGPTPAVTAATVGSTESTEARPKSTPAPSQPSKEHEGTFFQRISLRVLRRKKTAAPATKPPEEKVEAAEEKISQPEPTTSKSSEKPTSLQSDRKEEPKKVEAEAQPAEEGKGEKRSQLLEKLKRYTKKKSPGTKEEVQPTVTSSETTPVPQSDGSSAASGKASSDDDKSMARRLLRRFLSKKKKSPTESDQEGAAQGGSSKAPDSTKEGGQKDSGIADQKGSVRDKEIKEVATKTTDSEKKAEERKSDEAGSAKKTTGAEQKGEKTEKKAVEAAAAGKKAEGNSERSVEPTPSEQTPAPKKASRLKMFWKRFKGKE
ncbi:unnamed protein product [Haemonchus placei]|uniref:non-specific serine/threonine protein kinase n=1 Tax=Haemonchus placei TaxID=6290 RepID=A0A0N4WE05_HAEPC|nr:unnamed protein product [Haemonchus placei]